ncbi:MAG: acyl-CoA reductase [Bacteroidetes bacterium]|nr:acyl-CoA reductase [Bacteroidota bacterium]
MEKRLLAFIELGRFLHDFLTHKTHNNGSVWHKKLEKAIDESFLHNGWFTRQNVLKALQGIAFMLDEKEMTAFAVNIKEPVQAKVVAVIMAGNIPLVGFHDFLCVLLSGNKILVKPSSNDTILLLFLIEWLIETEPSFKEKISLSESKLSCFDAVIATGSNNSALYFEKYFGKYPHIIRKNRTSAALLTGNETPEELGLLGHDIFDYYGLGCRNVSKLWVPKNYDISLFFKSIFGFSEVIQNKKYANNYEYNRAIYLLNNEKFLDNNFILLKKSESLHSPIAVLFYEEYENTEEVLMKLKKKEKEIQCVVSLVNTDFSPCFFGASQSPKINDFADNVNTLAFLNSLT